MEKVLLRAKKSRNSQSEKSISQNTFV